VACSCSGRVPVRSGAALRERWGPGACVCFSPAQWQLLPLAPSQVRPPRTALHEALRGILRRCLFGGLASP
jgi:hypothetical protein